MAESDNWGQVLCGQPEGINWFSIAVTNAVTKATCRKKGWLGACGSKMVTVLHCRSRDVCPQASVATGVVSQD